MSMVNELHLSLSYVLAFASAETCALIGDRRWKLVQLTTAEAEIARPRITLPLDVEFIYLFIYKLYTNIVYTVNNNEL